jgi:hypothetical protein
MNPTQTPPQQNTPPQPKNTPTVNPPIADPSTAFAPQASTTTKTSRGLSNTAYKFLGILFCLILLVVGVSSAVPLLNNKRVEGSFVASGCEVHYTGGSHGGYNYQCSGVFTPTDSSLQPSQFTTPDEYITTTTNIAQTTVAGFELVNPNQTTGINGDQIYLNGSLSASPIYWIVLAVGSGLVGLFLVYNLIRQRFKKI